MMMREDKQKPSHKKTLMQQAWFWPAIYGGMAVLIVAVILGFNQLNNGQTEKVAVEDAGTPNETLLETATGEEKLKYPMQEELVNEVAIVQDFYDVTADETTRENALLVFNQVFTTSTGVSIAINSEPFQVLAAMSGEVAEVKVDEFTGNTITLNHPNGMQTRYNSVADILVKTGDKVTQGEQIGTSQANDRNPSAGIHVYFEVLEQGKFVNPRKYLSF